VTVLTYCSRTHYSMPANCSLPSKGSLETLTRDDLKGVAK